MSTFARRALLGYRALRPATGLGRSGPASPTLGLVVALLFVQGFGLAVFLGCGDDPTGPVAHCIALPDTLLFDSVLVGGDRERTLTLINSGAAVLEAIPQFDSPDFGLPGVDSSTVLSVTPGDTLALTVLFTPTSVGEKNGVLSFANGSCPGIALQGRGEPVDCSVEPAELEFGSVLVGQNRPRSVAIINSSAAVLETRPFTSSGDFGLPEVGARGVLHIDPGDTLSLTIVFAPTAGGDRNAVLGFREGYCPEIPLHGWGDLVACAVEPSALDFGSVWYADGPARSVQVTNVGTLPLEGTVGNCGEAFVVEAGAGLFRLEPGEFQEIRIRFRPPRSGTFGCELNLGAEVCVGPVLTGTAVQTWRIKEDRSGDAPTIQAGIDSAAVGDTVLVSAGWYRENINFLGKDIVLKSTNGPETTIIDGSGRNDSVVLFESTESRSCVLQGFTITGGEGTKRYGGLIGGGIMCAQASSTIRGNIIKDNEAIWMAVIGAGGGMAVGTGNIQDQRPAPLIEDNVFQGNVAAGIGGGLVVSHTSGTTIIRNNVFIGNETLVGDGAGIYVRQATSGEIRIVANQFLENIANDHGGAIHVTYFEGSPKAGPTVISHNLMVGNIARGLEFIDNGSGGGIYSRLQRGRITHNTIVLNVGGGESSCSGGGILLIRPPADLLLSSNIIAGNDGCGIACIETTDFLVGPNLLWENLGGDLGSEGRACPNEWREEVTIADPLFCNPEGGDFTVAENSPALTVGATMGAFPEPGCGPKTPDPGS